MPFGYTVSYTGTLTAAGGDTTLFEIVPADDHPLTLDGLRIGVTSEVGDAQDENLLISIRHFAATLTSSNGSAVTPAKNYVAKDPAASFTAEANGATIATTSGANTVLEYLVVNVRANPAEFWWTDPLYQHRFLQGETLIVQLDTAVADDMTIAMTAFIRED